VDSKAAVVTLQQQHHSGNFNILVQTKDAQHS
jgi:hypothetical protein